MQLNRGESRHSLARAIFHGQKGGLRQRYREGQEDQLGALGLVVNALALWNTRYLGLALARLRAEGLLVNPEDVARLSPLSHEHITCSGATLSPWPSPWRTGHSARYTTRPPRTARHGQRAYSGFLFHCYPLAVIHYVRLQPVPPG